MKRRLNIMVGLVHAPEVLFLDEPTVGIDAQARTKILDLIRDMNEQGLTVLYTTHYLEEAEQLCDRIGVIDQGVLAAIGDREELISQIGEQDSVRVHVDDHLSDQLTSVSETWDGVQSAKVYRGKVQIQCSDGAQVVSRLQQWLGEHDSSLDQLEVIRPNLETLYLKVTGRALRE